MWRSIGVVENAGESRLFLSTTRRFKANSFSSNYRATCKSYYTTSSAVIAREIQKEKKRYSYLKCSTYPALRLSATAIASKDVGAPFIFLHAFGNQCAVDIGPSPPDILLQQQHAL